MSEQGRKPGPQIEGDILKVGAARFLKGVQLRLQSVYVMHSNLRVSALNGIS
jgi:hypothetical protein